MSTVSDTVFEPICMFAGGLPSLLSSDIMLNEDVMLFSYRSAGGTNYLLAIRRKICSIRGTEEASCKSIL
jgi:hypothetical protein